MSRATTLVIIRIASAGNFRCRLRAPETDRRASAFCALTIARTAAPTASGSLRNEYISGRHAGKSEIAHFVGIITAAHIDQDFPRAADDRGFAAHGVGPKSIDLAGLQCARGKDTE